MGETTEESMVLDGHRAMDPTFPEDGEGVVCLLN